MQIIFWILAILASLAIGYWVYLADRRRAVPYPWLTAGLRALVILLTCMLLLAPAISVHNQETRKPVILFLQDNSESIAHALKGDTSSYRNNVNSLIEDLSKDYRVITWGFGERIQPDTLFGYGHQTTDIASSIAQAIEFYGQQNLGAVVLATDGRFNRGLNPAYQDLPFQGSLYTVALGDSAEQKDLRITNVYANRTVSLNSQFEIRADIVARRANGYTGNVNLRQVNGSATGNAAIHVTSDRYDRSVSFTTRATTAGLHHYVITIPPAEGEQNTANNRKDVFVEVVSEKKKILLAASAPHPDINAIREALPGVESYELTVRTADNLPASFAEYDVIILHSLPSAAVPVRQLAEGRKAVWFIMGANSNNAAFNQLQTLARLNVNTMNLQHVFASYNSAFLSFTLPQNIHAVMDKMPPLAVPAGTIQANPTAQVVFSAKSNPQMPLWLVGNGTPPAALLVGEGLWRWRMFEYRHFNSHEVVDEAIRQTVSLLSANVNDRPFQVALPKYAWSDREAISFNAYLLNENNEQVNSADATLTITDSAGRKQTYSFERSGTAYRLNIGVRPAGTYTFTANTELRGKKYTTSGTFVVQSMPIELMETGADYPLLHQLARKHNGALIPGTQVASLRDSIRNNANIKPVIEAETTSVPLVDWKWYFFLILLFAVAEWLLRKYWMAQ